MGAFVVYCSYFVYVVSATAAKFMHAVSGRIDAYALVCNLDGLLHMLFVKDLSC